MLQTFDPLDLSDPYPFYAWARHHMPVFHDEQSNCWVVSRYADVRAVLADEARYSAEAERLSYAGLSPEAIAVLQPIAFERLYGLSSTENPDHDRLKRVALPLFNELFLRHLKPQLQKLADTFVGRLVGNHDADLVATVFHQLPAEAIFVMLGVPVSDVPRVKEWSASRLALTWGTAKDQLRHAQNVVHYWQYCQELVDRKMREPADDLPSALGAAVRDKVLTRHEVNLFCYGLLFSGHATTSAFLAESVRLLLATGTWPTLAADPDRTAPTADELLRLCPSAFTRRRVALDEVVVQGQTIPKGATVLLIIGSANRDEAVFVTPESLLLNRQNAAKHLTFGHGFHYCIGAKVVRLEYSTIVECLLRRYPRMRVASGYSPQYNRNLSIRALKSLDVVLDAP